MLAQLSYMFLILYALIRQNLHISLVATNLLYKIKQKNKMHFFFKRINAFYKSIYDCCRWIGVSCVPHSLFHALQKKDCKKEFPFLQSF